MRHIKTIDVSLKYLELCKEIKFLDQTDGNDLLSRLENNIKEYSYRLNQKIDEVFIRISDYTEVDEKFFYIKIVKIYKKFQKNCLK
jgi:hypothetical protein